MLLPALGIDIAKAKFDVALLQDGQLHRQIFSNRLEDFPQLTQWLNQHGATQVHACLEATGAYGDDLALFLNQAGHTISVVNPTCIKAFRQSELGRTKTDRTDAALIARYCESKRPRPWTPPLPEMRELRDLVRRLDSLQQLHQQEANRLTDGHPTALVQASLQAVLNFLEHEAQEIKRLIHEHLQRSPLLRTQRDLIVSIPGIAELTAAKLLAEFQDIRSYASAREMAAHAGLTPQHKDSGSSVHGKPHLSKIGSARLRKALYMPAIVAKQYNPVIKAFCERLVKRGKKPMAIIGAAMRKLLHLVYGVLKSNKPFDPEYARTQP
jgi:transposase